MNVVSFFDGMSCGQIALNKLGVKVDNYFAAEIDKYPMQVTQANFPNTIQLGDVTKVEAKDLPKIDLFMGGSPCQGFSFAGKQLAFDDPRSALFFEFVRMWNEIKAINPNAKFLLENVNMKKNELRIISEYLGVFPVNINSNLVSAQNRNRWYWTNIRVKEAGLFSDLYTDIPQPEDKGILLKDILQPESEVDKKYYLSNAALIRAFKKEYSTPKINPDKTGTLNTKNNSPQCSFDSGTTFIKVDKQGNEKADQNKEGCLTGGGNSGGNHSDMDIICVSQVGRRIDENGIRKDYDKTIPAVQRLEPNTDNKTNCLTSVSKDNLILQLPHGFNKGGFKYDGKAPSMTKSSWDRNNILVKNVKEPLKGISIEGKAPTQRPSTGNCTDNKHNYQIINSNRKLRRLTPIECERLQTVPDNYTNHVSDTQRYKMLGNGWTVDVIAHILSFLEI